MSAWIDQIFEAEAAAKGDVVRRKISDVEKFASYDELRDAVLDRGFHLIETGDQFVILCNTGSFKIHC